MPLTEKESLYLSWLRDHGNGLMDQSAILSLAEYVGVQSPQLAGISKTLVDQGFIHRAQGGDPFENTHEAFVLTLLPKGRAALDAFEASSSSVDQPRVPWSFLKPWTWPFFRSRGQ